MEKAYDGRQVVGMDLHRRRSVLVRMTEDGRRLGTARITNSPAELRKEIARTGKARRWCSRPRTGGTGRRTLWRLRVRRCTWRTRWGSRHSATGVKNDERDSADLADLLRIPLPHHRGSRPVTSRTPPAPLPRPMPRS